MTACVAIVQTKHVPHPDPFFSLSFPDLGRGEGAGGAMVKHRDFGRSPAWPPARNDLMTGVRFGSPIPPRFPVFQGIQICNSFKLRGRFLMAEVEALRLTSLSQKPRAVASPPWRGDEKPVNAALPRRLFPRRPRDALPALRSPFTDGLRDRGYKT